MRVLLSTNVRRGSELDMHSGANPLAQRPPINLCYLARQLLDAGHKVQVLDCDSLRLGLDDAVKGVRDFSPDLVGVTLFSESLAPTYEYTRRLAEFTEVVLGGPHASAMPKRTMEEFTHINYLMRGECEHTLVELCDTIEGGREGQVKEISGLSYRRAGRVRHNLQGKLIDDLDSLPYPARELLRENYDSGLYFYHPMNGDRKSDIMVSSRGCPYGCRFCYRMSDGYRFRSAENILGEILEIHSLGVRNIEFMDDNFTINKKNCIRTLELLKAENLDVNLKLRSRVDSMDKGLARKMAESGVKVVVYGLESGSQSMLDAMGKGTTVKMNYRACRITREAGMYCYGDLIIGYPGETQETVGETIDFLRKAEIDGINGPLPLVPYPDTNIYEQAKMDGSLVGDWSMKQGSPHVRIEGLTREEVLSAGKMIQSSFYNRPEFYLKFIKRNLKDFNLPLVRNALIRKLKSPRKETKD